MPIYEYRCESCGATRELILKPGEVARPTCPGCRKRMKRMISPTAFILKGAGWFVNDYPSHDRKRGMEADKAKPAAEGAAASGKEAVSAEPKKPATKVPAKAAEKPGKRKARGGE